MKLKIKGKLPSYIKREEVRAIIQATNLVCDYHNKSRNPDVVTMMIENDIEKLGKNWLTGGNCWGWARWSDDSMALYGGIKEKNQFIAVLIHEMLHLCVRHKGGQERPTSTLNAKLQPMIISIANTLAKGVYQRAAWFAHCKIAYKRTKKNDSYNGDEWNIKEETKGIKL